VLEDAVEVLTILVFESVESLYFISLIEINQIIFATIDFLHEACVIKFLIFEKHFDIHHCFDKMCQIQLIFNFFRTLVVKFDNFVLICLFSMHVVATNKALAENSHINELEPPEVPNT
jgi:hypothetical protein